MPQCYLMPLQSAQSMNPLERALHHSGANRITDFCLKVVS